MKILFLIALKILERNKLGISVGILIILVIVFAQIKFKLFYNQNSITLGFIGTYQSHDLPQEVTRLLSKSLVSVDKDGHVKGELASGWETNNDATIFKFKLKDNLSWIDGSKVKSADLEFSIPNVQVSLPNDQTIQFNLKEPYSPLPGLLTKPVFKKGSMIGTGPYKIEKIEKSRIFITKIALVSSDANLPAVFIRFYPSEAVAITGFSLGEVQVLSGFLNTKVFDHNPKVSIRQNVDYTKIVSILFNTKDAQLSSRSLRQALAFAAPQIENEEVANNPYPHTFWAYDESAKKYLSNQSEAKEALTRAKSTMPDEKLDLDLILTATPNLEPVGEKVVNSWKELGLNAKVRVESGIAQNFQALLITQSIPQDPDQYFLWHATQGKTNLTKYDSKRVDKDLEDGRKMITEDERKDKYFDFQKALLEDAPAIFLYFPKYNIAYLKKSENLLDKILSLE